MATKAKPAAKKATTGTAVAVKKSGNLVSIREQMAQQVAELANKTAPASGNSIRVTQDKKFLLPDGTTSPGPIDLVVVDFCTRHNFYEGKFDAKDIVPPACFAIGENPLKMFPSPNAPLAQAQDCQTCPNNQFGSDGDGKACKNSRRLAVLPPDADADTPMWELQTSPTANKGFDGFVAGVGRVFQVPPVGVVVSVGFDENVTYAKLVFSDPRPNENLEIHFSRQEEAREMLRREPDVSQFVSKVKAPASRKAGARR